ncbi:E3 ubiquitin-protein ligase TRIM45-like [Oculina patagonica]
MASVTPEEIDSHLSCAICLEEFKEPKVLACLHTYCKECLVKLTITQGAVITCPECRQDTKIVDGDVNKLQTNFWVNNFLTLRNAQQSTSSGKPLICEHCHSCDPAVSRCTSCCVFMCKFCVTAHKRINATKDHQILSLAEVEKLGSKALKKPALCTKHSEETLKLFCQTCQKAICRDCIIVDHRDHTYNFVSEVADKERKIIQNVLRETKTKERSVNDGLKAVQSMEVCVRIKAAKINKEVDTFFDSQVKELEKSRANLKNEVTRQEQGKLTQLNSQRERLSSFQAQLKSGINFCDQAIADGDAMALLSVKKQVMQRLSQLNASQYDCQPCQNDYLKLQVCKTIRDIGTMAVLHHVAIDPAKCILSMVGGEKGVLYQTLAGQTVDFLLTVDHKGAAEIVGSYTVSAIVKYQKQGMRETQEESLPVCDNGDGSHSFSFRPEDAGQARLSVMVEGQDIRGSPFVWQVKDKESGFKVQGKKMKMSRSAASQDTTVDRKGMQCWKLKLVSYSASARIPR